VLYKYSDGGQLLFASTYNSLIIIIGYYLLPCLSCLLVISRHIILAIL